MIWNILDILGAIIVIISIASRFKDRRFWIVYSLGCVMYIGININQGLFGQTAINVVGATVAIWNYKKAKGDRQ